MGAHINKVRRVDFRDLCSWDIIILRVGIFRVKRRITIYYTPIKNEIVMISPTNKKFPFMLGDTKVSVREWIGLNDKCELVDFKIKRYRG